MPPVNGNRPTPRRCRPDHRGEPGDDRPDAPAFEPPRNASPDPRTVPAPRGAGRGGPGRRLPRPRHRGRLDRRPQDPAAGAGGTPRSAEAIPQGGAAPGRGQQPPRREPARIQRRGSRPLTSSSSSWPASPWGTCSRSENGSTSRPPWGSWPTWRGPCWPRTIGGSSIATSSRRTSCSSSPARSTAWRWPRPLDMPGDGGRGEPPTIAGAGAIQSVVPRQALGLRPGPSRHRLAVAGDDRGRGTPGHAPLHGPRAVERPGDRSPDGRLCDGSHPVPPAGRPAAVRGRHEG